MKKLKEPTLEEALETKSGKYAVNRKKGMKKGEAALAAGFADSAHTSVIEQSVAYNVVVKHFKDEFLGKMSLSEVADALVDNIKQSDMKVIDRGSRNKAIEIALSRIEPDKAPDEGEDRVFVIIK